MIRGAYLRFPARDAAIFARKRARVARRRALWRWKLHLLEIDNPLEPPADGAGDRRVLGVAVHAIALE